jgi:hypothetical protein
MAGDPRPLIEMSAITYVDLEAFELRKLEASLKKIDEAPVSIIPNDG